HPNSDFFYRARRPHRSDRRQLQETSSRGHVARPLPAPCPPPGSVLRADAVTADPGAGPPGPRERRAASGGAEPPLSPPPPRRLIRGLSVPPGDAGPGRALGSAPSGLANFAGPAARRAAPRAHVRSGCGAAGTSAGLGDQGLSPAPGRGASCWPEAGAGRLCPPPLPGRSSARRAESLAGGPGSGGAAPPRTPGARRPPGQEKQRPPRPPQRLGRAAGRLGRSLAEPAALGFPGSASGEPLLPEPSGSCAGRVSRGRARRRRRRRRGEGGRALPRQAFKRTAQGGEQDKGEAWDLETVLQVPPAARKPTLVLKFAENEKAERDMEICQGLEGEVFPKGHALPRVAVSMEVAEDHGPRDLVLQPGCSDGLLQPGARERLSPIPRALHLRLLIRRCHQVQGVERLSTSFIDPRQEANHSCLRVGSGNVKDYFPLRPEKQNSEAPDPSMKNTSPPPAAASLLSDEGERSRDSNIYHQKAKETAAHSSATTSGKSSLTLHRTGTVAMTPGNLVLAFDPSDPTGPGCLLVGGGRAFRICTCLGKATGCIFRSPDPSPPNPPLPPPSPLFDLIARFDGDRPVMSLVEACEPSAYEGREEVAATEAGDSGGSRMDGEDGAGGLQRGCREARGLDEMNAICRLWNRTRTGTESPDFRPAQGNVLRVCGAETDESEGACQEQREDCNVVQHVQDPKGGGGQDPSRCRERLERSLPSPTRASRGREADEQTAEHGVLSSEAFRDAVRPGLPGACREEMELICPFNPSPMAKFTDPRPLIPFPLEVDSSGFSHLHPVLKLACSLPAEVLPYHAGAHGHTRVPNDVALAPMPAGFALDQTSFCDRLVANRPGGRACPYITLQKQTGKQSPFLTSVHHLYICPYTFPYKLCIFTLAPSKGKVCQAPREDDPSTCARLSPFRPISDPRKVATQSAHPSRETKGQLPFGGYFQPIREHAAAGAVAFNKPPEKWPQGLLVERESLLPQKEWGAGVHRYSAIGELAGDGALARASSSEELIQPHSQPQLLKLSTVYLSSRTAWTKGSGNRTQFTRWSPAPPGPASGASHPAADVTRFRCGRRPLPASRLLLAWQEATGLRLLSSSPEFHQRTSKVQAYCQAQEFPEVCQASSQESKMHLGKMQEPDMETLAASWTEGPNGLSIYRMEPQHTCTNLKKQPWGRGSGTLDAKAHFKGHRQSQEAASVTLVTRLEDQTVLQTIAVSVSLGSPMQNRNPFPGEELDGDIAGDQQSLAALLAGNGTSLAMGTGCNYGEWFEMLQFMSGPTFGEMRR
ncbi:hypothetical protein EI555_004421, partial [Monodon monoceros]